jgi:hypothetical protein
LFSSGAALAESLVGAVATEHTRFEKLVYVGDTRVRILVAETHRKGRRELIYFHPHENEHGSAVVTRHVIDELGGRLVEIRSQGERMITFRLRGKTYSFDPNRMFTDVGLDHSLNHFGPMLNPAAFETARNFRNAVINQLGGGKTPIVAVHNNSEGGINALSFQSGGALETQAAKVAINPSEHAHDFFLVLDDGIFTRLHHAGFNVVLQSPNPPDDGSLSVFCLRHNWPYVNVEASERDMTQQERMLEALSLAIPKSAFTL